MLRPRNDFVIVREVLRDKLGGVHVPGTSREGKLFFVHAVGPKVEDLRVEEQIMMTGQQGVDWSYIPGQQGLLVIREANVVLVHAEDPPDAVVPEGASER